MRILFSLSRNPYPFPNSALWALNLLAHNSKWHFISPTLDKVFHFLFLLYHVSFLPSAYQHLGVHIFFCDYLVNAGLPSKLFYPKSRGCGCIWISLVLVTGTVDGPS